MTNTVILLLAAGESKRFGSSKQMAEWQGKSLINSAVEQCLQSRASKVFVVVGHNSEAVVDEIGDLPVTIIENSMWRNGMAESLKCGMNAIYSRNENQSILVSVADQPYLSFNVLDLLITAHEKGPTLVASKYQNGVIGVPALFGSAYKNELENLGGDQGAKEILVKYLKDLQTVEFRLGDIDVDRPGDLPVS